MPLGWDLTLRSSVEWGEGGRVRDGLGQGGKWWLLAMPEVTNGWVLYLVKVGAGFISG